MDIEELKKTVDDLGNLLVTDEEFNEAAEMVKAVTNLADNDRLQLYGLYKQSTVGDVNTSRPWAVEFVACAKWDAWKSYSGWENHKAKLGYICIVRKLCGNDMPGEANKSSAEAGMGKSASTPVNPEGSDDTPWNETEKIFEAIVSNDMDTVQSLLDSGSIDVNCCTDVENDSMSPLHYAADRGHLAIVKLLLSRGANVNAINADGNTSLMLAVVCEHEDVIDYLVEMKADVSIENADGESVLTMPGVSEAIRAKFVAAC